MLVGIIFQLGMKFGSVSPLRKNLFISPVAIVIFTVLAAEFIARVALRRPLHKRTSFPSNPQLELKPSPSFTFLQPESTQSAAIASDVNLKEKMADAEHDKVIPRNKVNLLVLAVGFSTLCLFIR